VSNGAWVLALVGVLASAAAAFFYVRVIVLMYFSEPSASAASTVANPGFGTLFAILLAVVVTVVLGIVPTVLFGPAEAASVFVR
jgi:NADH-quinone oxidoreductase subunit N